jgi:hypothetical protein
MHKFKYIIGGWDIMIAQLVLVTSKGKPQFLNSILDRAYVLSVLTVTDRPQWYGPVLMQNKDHGKRPVTSRTSFWP